MSRIAEYEARRVKPIQDVGKQIAGAASAVSGSVRRTTTPQQPASRVVRTSEGRKVRLRYSGDTARPVSDPAAARRALAENVVAEKRRVASVLGSSAKRKTARETGVPEVAQGVSLPAEPVFDYLNTPGYIVGNLATGRFKEAGKNAINLVPGTKAIDAVAGRSTLPSQAVEEITGWKPPWYAAAGIDIAGNPASYLTGGTSAGTAAGRAATAMSAARSLPVTAGKAAGKSGAARVPQAAADAMTAAQRTTYAKTFGAAPNADKLDEIIGSVLDVGEAAHAAARTSRSGIRVNLAGTNKGVDIPLLSARASRTMRRKGREVLDPLRHQLVSQRGPQRAVGMATRYADNFSEAAMVKSAKDVLERVKTSKLTPDERILAKDVIEGTAPEGAIVTPKVQAFAQEMERLVDDATDEYLRAGGKLDRIDQGYVFHALKPEDRARFLSERGRNAGVTFGRNPAFSKHRTDPALTIRDLKADGYDVPDDLAEIAMLRLAAHQRALADLRLIKGVEKRYGRPIKKGDNPPRGWAVMESPHASKELAVPTSVAETVKRAAASREIGIPKSKAGRIAKRGNRSWKQAALLTTGYDIRNQVGDMVLLAQEGRNPFQGLAGATKRRVVRTAGPKGSGLTWDETADLARTLGATQHGAIVREVASDLRPFEGGAARAGAKKALGGREAQVVDTLKRGRIGRENLQRLYPFASDLKKRGPIMATERANKAVFDYGDVGELVQRARTNPGGMPFITWTAKNLPKQARNLAERPRNAIGLDALSRSLQEESGNPSGLPLTDFTKGRIPLPIPGVGWVTVDIPQSGLSLVSKGPRETVRQLLAQMGPLPQAVAATGLNISPFTGSTIRKDVPLGKDAQMVQGIPGIGKLLLGKPDKTLTYNAEGKKVSVPSGSGIGAYLLNAASPQTGQFSRVAGGTTPGQPWLQSASSTLGGFRYQPFDDKAAIQRAIGARIAKIFDLQSEIRTKRKAGGDLGDRVVRLKRLAAEVKDLRKQAARAR